jgi:hypothetical protein
MDTPQRFTAKMKNFHLRKKQFSTPRGNSAYEHPNHSVAPNVAVWKGHENEFPVQQQWGCRSI